jgi:membrane-bound ClpP family serine protease
MSGAQWELIGGAVGLLLLAGTLLALEFAVVSWGLLTLAAALCALGGLAMAWSASTAAGWVYLAAAPVIAVLAVRVGLALLRSSAGGVVGAAITADAGYHHRAAASGVSAGSRGELVTDAMPTGRARFAGGEADVQVEGAALPRGAAVVVLRIDGPVVVVADGR